MAQDSIRVNMPDGRVVHFPSSMSETDITQAVSRLATPEPEKKSISGFLSNVVESGKDFVVDTVKGLPSLGRGALRVARAGMGDPNAAREIVEAVPQIAGALKDHAVERYGSLDKAGETLYNDPVGALSDVSTIASGGSLLPARAAGVTGRIARGARAVERATNPMRAIAKPMATATEVGAAALVRPSLNPPKRLRAQQHAPLEIERTAIRGGIVTRGQAGKRAKGAAAQTTARAQAATDAGVAMPRADIVQFPNTLDRVEKMTPNVREFDQLAALEAETAASLPASLTPSELLSRRRVLDDELDSVYRAAERGGPPPGVREKGQRELAGRMRTTLRDVAPDVRASDDAARQFGLVERAMGEAADRPSRLTTMAAGGGAGGFALSGNPTAAAVSALIGAGLQFPQIPLLLGIPPAAFTRMLASDPGVRAALLARLAGQEK